ncbi:MAG: GSCFA domain-containing protein [Flavobacteriales bacterium]|nr:GSCFA domain-containing protein [Flavobacteriales bacterium]
MGQSDNKRPKHHQSAIIKKYGRGKGGYRTWFRGEHTNYNPDVAALESPESVGEYVLKGWSPEAPIIDHSTRITAFGSCFAENISNWLSRRSFNVLNKADPASNAYVVRMGEGMVNTFVIKQQFEWAWENKKFEESLWHGYDAEEYSYDETVRQETKAIFDATDVFILTFGLSEIWYDEVSSNVFWRTVPVDAYDPKRHKFRVSTVEENCANILEIRRLISKHRPDAKTILTLSPIPLIATFRNAGCLTANSVSKSTLRVAIDQAMSEAADDSLYYWPSYELVADVFHLPYKQDRRHIRADVIEYILKLFEVTWCKDSEIDETEMLEAFVKAKIDARCLPDDLRPLLKKRKPWPLRKYLSDHSINSDVNVEKAQRETLERLLIAWRKERAVLQASSEQPKENPASS